MRKGRANPAFPYGVDCDYLVADAAAAGLAAACFLA